jgi:predicted permease
MNLMNLWNLQGELLLLLLVGAVLRRTGILPGEAKSILTDFVIFVALPCNIIVSFRTDLEGSVIVSFVVVLLVSFGIQILSMVLGKVLYRKQSEGRKSVLRYATLVSNAGFMGLPIAGELFGPTGLMLASIYLIPQRISMWSAGLACFSGENPDWKLVAKKIAVHPCIIAVYIGLILMFTGYVPPTFMMMTMQSISACTTALSMILVGTLLGEITKEDMKMEVSLLGFSLVRLFLLPLATYGLCHLFSVSPIITGVSVLLTAMPGGSTTAILASKYHGDAVYASKLVAFSTILTMVSVPLWGMVL